MSAKKLKSLQLTSEINTSKEGIEMSRWSSWSRGQQEKPRFFDNFLSEALDTGNPAVGSSPAERARQLGLQSDGSGGYIDPETGQVVARTVNGELVFYDNRGLSGGAVSDGSGGSALANAQPSWSDPMTGMSITPPSRPESPEEQHAVPDPIPATAPAGYDSFINQSKMRAYTSDKQQKNSSIDVNNPMQAAPTQGINPIGADGSVNLGPGPMGEEIGDNSDMRQKTGDLPAPKPKTLDDFRQQYQQFQQANNQQFASRNKDSEKAKKQAERAGKPLRALVDNPNIDPKVKTRILNLGNNMYKHYVGGRKDKKLNEPNQSVIDGLTSRREQIETAFAPDPETGYPSQANIEKFLEEGKIFDYPREVTEAFFKSLPPDIRKYWGGQGVKDIDGFHDWACRDGSCAMSGAYMGPEFLNQDHQIPHSTARNPDIPKELKDHILSTNNLWGIHKSVNQLMGSKSKPQFLQDVADKYNNPDSQVEGLQDFLFDLNTPREEIHGNLPRMLADTLLTPENEDGSQRYLREEIDMDGVNSAIDLGQSRQQTIIDGLLEAFDSRFDPDGLVGKRKIPEDLKPLKGRLKKARDMIKSIKGNGGITPVLRALGIPTSVFVDSARGGTFSGVEDMLQSVIQQMTGKKNEDQQEIITKWSDMLRDSNSRARSKWDEIHQSGNETLSGLDKKERLAKELEYKKEAQRYLAQLAIDNGFLDMDSLEDGTNKSYLADLLAREQLFEMNMDDTEEMPEMNESDYNFTEDFDIRNLLEILKQFIYDDDDDED